MRGMAAIIHRGPMAKLFSWTIFKHDFELYPFDRKLSYDFVQIHVMLMLIYSRSTFFRIKKQTDFFSVLFKLFPQVSTVPVAIYNLHVGSFICFRFHFLITNSWIMMHVQRFYILSGIMSIWNVSWTLQFTIPHSSWWEMKFPTEHRYSSLF